MALSRLTIAGYRSLRDIDLPLGSLNVVTGPNGSGKSNLYRSLWLLAQICEGEFARSIAREGGFLSVLWAGPRTSAKEPVRMSLGFQTGDFHFKIVCGFPQPSETVFAYDPQIKEELVWFSQRRKPTTTLLQRNIGNTWIRDLEGNRVDYPLMLAENESVLSQLREPHRYPELSALREEVRQWRFYHGFRTDDHAPLRSPQVSVRTPVLSHDGSDLAAALQTIIEIGNGARLMQAIAAALPGRMLRILHNDDNPYSKSPQYTELSTGLETVGCRRYLLARELSDGTLKFFCLAAALLSPHPPALLAFNEPESSLHPDLLPSLAGLIVEASQRSQIWVSTHSPILANAICTAGNIQPIQLQLVDGETVVTVANDDD